MKNKKRPSSKVTHNNLVIILIVIVAISVLVLKKANLNNPKSDVLAETTNNIIGSWEFTGGTPGDPIWELPTGSKYCTKYNVHPPFNCQRYNNRAIEVRSYFTEDTDGAMRLTSLYSEKYTYTIAGKPKTGYHQPGIYIAYSKEIEEGKKILHLRMRTSTGSNTPFNFTVSSYVTKPKDDERLPLTKDLSLPPDGQWHEFTVEIQSKKISQLYLSIVSNTAIKKNGPLKGVEIDYIRLERAQ